MIRKNQKPKVPDAEADPIRAAIVEAMRRQGLNQTAVAESTGIPRSNISMYLNGKSNLRSDSLCRIFGVLGLEIRVR